MKKIGKLILIAGASAFAVMPLVSQTPASQKPSFEVISVKPGAPDARGFRGGGPRGNSLSMTNVPVRVLVQQAYSRSAGSGPGPQIQIIGAPGWMDSDFFDVQAKADCSGGPIPRERMQLMIQSLLEERFQLKAHYETRELPIYNLVVAKDGPKLKLSEDQTASPLASPPQLCGAQPAALPALPPPPGPGQRGAPFDPRTMPRGAMIMMMNPTTGLTMNATAVPIGNLVNLLQGQSGRPVIDKTGLKGLFDITLQFGMEGLPTPGGRGGGLLPPGGAIGGVAAGPGGAGPTEPNAAADPSPSLFTAIQEQLGLRLESTKGPVEVLVIDSIQKPTEN
jgi:uncharacterized protein (TIGR03435 family)